MADPLLIVQLTEFAAEGHAEYRVCGPARRLAATPGVTVVDVDPDHRHAATLAEVADVLILHATGPDYPPLAARRRSHGRATVLEASDDYFDPQPWQPYSVGWLDRGRQDQFWRCVAACDAVQTSTATLAERWKPVARRVVVFGNHLATVPALAPIPSRTLTLGWAGSATHLPDWAAVAQTVAGWVRGRPACRLAVMTDELAREFVRLPDHQYRFRPPGTLGDYFQFLRELDVAVVPLLPSAFNRGRTDLKFVELAAAGVVGVFAAEGPYPASVTDGRTGFLYRTPAELVQTLDRLASNPQLLATVRANAHAVAVARMTPDSDRLAFYRSLVSVTRPTPSLPAGAVTVGRYHRFPPGEPEQVVKSVYRSAGDPALLPQIAAVLQQHPDSVPARRAAARIARKAELPRQAAEFLEPLLADPEVPPSVLAEAADALAAAGDPTTAVALLERCVASNPAHPAAWTLLVRLTGDRRRSEQASANQPRNYATALAVLPLLPAGERAQRFVALIDRFAADLHPEERPRLAVAFSRAAVDHLPRSIESLAAVRRAVEAFPESARLADLHAELLRACDRHAEADAESARALTLCRLARTFAAEYPDPTAVARRWAVDEYQVRHPMGNES